MPLRETIFVLGTTLLCVGCMMQNPSDISASAYICDFPLHGTWISPNTPGSKIPSHGTDMFGQTYAYDFVGIQEDGARTKFYKTSLAIYLLKGVKLKDCYGWGADVYMPFDCEIVAIENGVYERDPANIVSDIKYMMNINRKMKTSNLAYAEVAGNYIIGKVENKVYCLLAHLQTGSVVVKPGDRMEKGAIVGKVGHSGNSTAPHLHFQLMDSQDLWTAKGIMCKFARYEIWKSGSWVSIMNEAPQSKWILRNR